MTALLGTAVLLWQLASGPVSGDGAISTTGDNVSTAPTGVTGAIGDAGSDRVRVPAVAETDDDPGSGSSYAAPAPPLPDTATVITGTASWYCGAGSRCTRGYPGGLYAAAGPALRVGDWRGRTVTVRSGSRSVRVTLIDWCACPSRVIDLYRDAFSRLASPSRGVLRVSVSWGDGVPATLPPTSTGG